ncbi:MULTISPECIES: helix-turn-helix domain-containing protein [unclassified Sinorhizobium]|uniref:helix-turn-helix domain-containing protein n=1 Tax=unclassified Sinorhizobium TaxID=2613772 RepID=UPI003523EED3
MITDVKLSQKSGDEPRLLFAAESGGEQGLGIFCYHFADETFFEAISAHHMVILQLGAPTPIFCKVGNRTLEHIAPVGNVTICPAETEASARSAKGFVGLLLTIPADPLALISAEQAHVKAQLSIKLSGIDDTLLAIAKDLVHEAAGDFSSGAIYWHELTEELIEHLVLEHCMHGRIHGRGVLAPDKLECINQYVLAHLAEPIDVDTLADVACRGRWQFPRIFRRSVGMSPYQYIIRLRLKRALKDIKAGGMSLAEIALASGFVDQSHLNRWMRRIYGTSPGQFANDRSRRAA